jgi:chemotaxis signal transduction protein
MTLVRSLPSERKALVFSAGGVRLALRLAQLREIVPVAPGAGEVCWRGEVLPAVVLSAALGLPAGPSPFALLAEGSPRMALRVEAVHGIVDLTGAEFFQLPARTPLPQPSPFSGAVVARGEVALEVAAAALGSGPLQPLVDPPGPPLDVGRAVERELCFARGERVYGVPLSLLVQVLECSAVAPVPLTPPSHRGLLYHGRALHPVLDMQVLYGGAASGAWRNVLLLDAGGTAVGVVADRVLGVAEGRADVVRPPWDAVFAC